MQKKLVLATAILALSAVSLLGCSNAIPSPSPAGTAPSESTSPSPSVTSSETPTPEASAPSVNTEVQEQFNSLVTAASTVYFSVSETNSGTFRKVLTDGDKAVVMLTADGLGDVSADVPLDGADYSFVVTGTTADSSWQVSRYSYSQDPDDYVTVQLGSTGIGSITGTGKYAGLSFIGFGATNE